jgi:hypothetical protein
MAAELQCDYLTLFPSTLLLRLVKGKAVTLLMKYRGFEVHTEDDSKQAQFEHCRPLLPDFHNPKRVWNPHSPKVTMVAQKSRKHKQRNPQPRQ